jgi:hypothetical protein
MAATARIAAEISTRFIGPSFHARKTAAAAASHEAKGWAKG